VKGKEGKKLGYILVNLCSMIALMKLSREKRRVRLVSFASR
jgi:hypothetical protein